ncbi:MAG: ABC transporter permease [Blastocatellia bacterium]
MQTLWQDLRYGARMLLKKPGFTLIAVITLGLGIGANTAIFSVVNAVLLRPLAYPEAERLMRIGRAYQPGQVYPSSEPKFQYWRDHNQSFEAMTAMQGAPEINLSGGAEPEYVRGLRVSHEFFRVMGVNPALGRGFTKEEERPDGERVAVLTDGLWRRRYGADAGIIGSRIMLNHQSYTVAGVMPPGFRFLWPIDVFTPLQLRPDSQSGGHSFTVIGRLKPGVTEAQAAAEMKHVAENFRASYPRLIQQNETINVASAQALMVGDARRPLLVLLGAVGFVLLIACANVANLQLAQQSARRRELAIRLALGAAWKRVARQLFTEALLLALAGGVAGLLLAWWGVELLKTLIPTGLIPRAEEIGFDWRVLAFNLGAAVFTGLFFGLAPTLQAKRVDVNHALKEGSGRGAAAASRQGMRGALVITEVALSLSLLVGAALLIRTFANLRQVETGFDPRNAMTFQMTLSGANYDTTAKTAEFYRRALERLRALPGVEAAAVTSNLPLQAQFNLSFTLAGQTEQSGSAQYRVITPDYFRAMKMAVRQGRAFTEADSAGAEKVIIVNEAFARGAFPNANPLGQRLCAGCGFGDPAMRAIVGVVSDTKQFDLASSSPATVFVPVAQIPDQLLSQIRQYAGTNFVLRGAGDPLASAAAVKREMLSLDPSIPIRNLRAMSEILAESIGSERFNMLLLGLFAGIGLVLAAVGIYGVISYSVAQRTQEIGIRMALGAQTRDVLKLVIRQGLMLAGIGVALGIAAAFALTRLMAGLLFGVRATDPLTYALAALSLTGVALLACLIPARRATKVDPMIALRCE